MVKFLVTWSNWSIKLMKWLIKLSKDLLVQKLRLHQLKQNWCSSVHLIVMRVDCRWSFAGAQGGAKPFRYCKKSLRMYIGMPFLLRHKLCSNVRLENSKVITVLLLQKLCNWLIDKPMEKVQMMLTPMHSGSFRPARPPSLFPLICKNKKLISKYWRFHVANMLAKVWHSWLLLV